MELRCPSDAARSIAKSAAAINLSPLPGREPIEEVFGGLPIQFRDLNYQPDLCKPGRLRPWPFPHRLAVRTDDRRPAFLDQADDCGRHRHIVELFGHLAAVMEGP